MAETTFEYKQSFWRKIKRKFDFLYDIRSPFYFCLLLIFVGVMFYISSLITANFTTFYTGDYTSQYIAMGYNGYDDWWHFLRTGSFVYWDPNTFLGADNITSNGYYYLFSPFFLPIIFFPREFVPQAMAIMSIVRITFAGMFFRAYLKKMGVSENHARIGAIAYAFSGWMAWYLWFNNFLDVTVIFPLILLGVEKVLQDKKPWLLALSLFLLSICCYFFIPPLVVCAFIYAMWRYFHRLKKNNWKDNLLILGLGFAGFLVGLMMAMLVFFPSFITSMSSSKYTGASYLDKMKAFFQAGDFDKLLGIMFNWNASDGKDYKAFYPIINFFFPPMTCRGTSLLVYSNDTYDEMAGSLWMYTPMIMFFVPAVIQSVKEKHYTVFIAIAFFIFALFAPFVSYALFGFTKAYLRWSLFLHTSFITYVCIYLDKMKQAPKWTLSAGFHFTVLGIIGAGICAKYVITTYTGANFTERVPIIWACVIEIIYVGIHYFVIRFLYDKEYLHYILLGIVAVEAIAVGNMVSQGHGYYYPNSANNGVEINNSLTSVIANVNSHDDSYFRTYTTLDNGRSSNNGMINNYNGTQMFHSIYNYNVKDFKYWVSWSDSYESWSAYYMEKRQDLDAFLGIKYYVVQKSKTKMDILENAVVNVPLDSVEVPELENKDFYVFKNENVSKLGYSYDSIIGYDDASATSFVNTSDLYLLRNEQMFLETAILPTDAYQAVKEEAGDDLSNYVMKDLSSADFTPLSIEHVTNNAPQFQYQAQYYSVPNSIDYDINRLNEIPTHYSPLGIKPSTNSNYFIFINRKDGHAFDEFFDNGTSVYVNSPYRLNYKVDIYLVDDTGNVITYDNHNDDSFNRADWRTQGLRGLYSHNRKIQSIVIYPRYYGIPDFRIAMESGLKHDQRMAKLNTYPLDDVKYVSTNEFTFKTNYSARRYVVTTSPYEKGWKVFAGSERLTTYKSQGGFVGFLANSGQTSYDMKYFNDDVTTGGIIAASGAFIFITSYIVFTVIEKKRRKDIISVAE